MLEEGWFHKYLQGANALIEPLTSFCGMALTGFMSLCWALTVLENIYQHSQAFAGTKFNTRPSTSVYKALCDTSSLAEFVSIHKPLRDATQFFVGC